MTRLKTDTNRMADKICMPACLCQLFVKWTEIKADIDFITKNKKQNCFVILLVCCVSLFEQKISVLSRKQTNRKPKNYPIKNCVRHAGAAKLGLLEQQASLIIAMEFLPLRPANFSSNPNVALHARSLGPPWINSFCSWKLSELVIWKLLEFMKGSISFEQL